MLKVVFLFACWACPCVLSGQVNTFKDPLPSDTNRSLEHNFVSNIFRDQRDFWFSPKKLDFASAQDLVLIGGAAAVLFSTDQATMQHHFQNPSSVKRSSTITNAAVLAIGGATAGTYLLGRWKSDDHKRETGILAMEAFTNSLLVTEGIKFAAGRQRPDEGDGTGRFRVGGNSFPSEHSAAAWSIATVFANEYPGPLTKVLSYGAASAISISRITGRKHFPSDVLIGSALGWYFGHRVYQSHHNGELGGNSIGTFYSDPDRARSYTPASTYVPLDSWVYPAMDRLAALGFLRTQFAGMKPWTRLECARLVEEASNRLGPDNIPGEAGKLLRSLSDEFRPETGVRAGENNVGLTLDSVYSRWTNITGTPLDDGYHFGQTITNDFGRPYASGLNSVTGISAHMDFGPFAMFVQGEFQHSPSSPALPLSVRETIQHIDQLPAGFLPPDRETSSVNRVRFLDAYLSTNVSNWQLSFGRQSLWWGPDRTGPMLLSDNAEPITMFRVDRVSPFRLPLLGQVRTEFFIGRLDGYNFMQGPDGLTGSFDRPLSRQPFIHGEKVAFKPTENLELSLSRTTLFAGSVYPLTLGRFGQSVFSLGNAGAGSENKPGDRRSAFDLTYRIPKLRNWLTFYADGVTDDQFTPIAYWDRSAWTAGIYMPQLPKLHKMDLRAEGIFTDLPIGGAVSNGFFYFNLTWRSGYTNQGNLLGSWIGRQGQGAQAWTTYHFSPRTFVEANFRHQKVSQEFLPEGGSLTDAGLRTAFPINDELTVSGNLQWERWMFPVIAPSSKSNITTSIQLTLQPKRLSKMFSRN